MSMTESGGRVARVEFTGTRSELFGLLLRGYLLMVPTVGIYRFWVTTLKRRFYWQHTVIDGEPLEYTGTAMQLLIGFLFALAFFLPVYITFFYLSTQAPEIALIGYAVVGVVLWFLSGYAIYRARDFRLSRTLWRGIRFDQRGNAWAYALRRFLWSIAVVLSAGLLYPFMASSLWRYRYNNSWYGDRQFRWTGSWKTIAGPYYLTYVTLVAATVAAIVAVGAGPSVVIDGVPMPSPAGWGWFLLVGLLAFLAWFYFRSREATRMFSEVWLGEARARVKVRARALLGQFVLYVLALIGVSVLLAAVAGIIAAGLFTGAISQASGSVAVDMARLAQSSWITLALLIGGYLLTIGSFALMGEVFLGYGFWMLVARGATISNADSLATVRATAEDRALVGEGLADALNVGAY
ncbi:MAG TPA: DUF898 domain-containing protein [Alphaproteobacteria bacterium]|nr:DUF898 domain-containing protein [Alphaproteobacteria bacterium]